MQVDAQPSLFEPDTVAIMPVEDAAQAVIDAWRAGSTDLDARVTDLELTLHRMRSGPAPSKIGLWATIREGAAWVKTRLIDGTTCPLCGQRCQVYRRTITSTMARALIRMWNAAGIEWVHLPSLVGAMRADEAKLVHWGLIEEEDTVRDDGGRAGYWRITDLGVQFVQGEASVPKYAWLYNKRCLGHDGPEVTIGECLGNKFRLDDLLGCAT